MREHDWLTHVLEHTAVHDGRPWSINPNLDGAGLSFGIMQWTQCSGGLGRLLAAMVEADPSTFVEVLGAGQPWVAHALLSVTARGSLSPVADEVLWHPTWLVRFAAAGEVARFQEVQYEEALRGEHMRSAFAVARTLEVPTERAVTLGLDRSVQQGPTRALSPAVRLSERWRQEGVWPEPQQRLSLYAGACAARFRRTSRPLDLWYNAARTLRWVIRPGDSPELALSADGTIHQHAPSSPSWHVAAGRFDLWDDILRRTSDVLLDPTLGDHALRLPDLE